PHFVANVHRAAVQLPAEKAAVVTRRGRVIASCVLAVQQHVEPGLTTRQAHAILPQAGYFSAQEERVNQALLEGLDRLAVFTPLVEYPKPIRRDRPQAVNAQQAVVFYVNLENLNEADGQRLTGQMQQELRRLHGFETALGQATSLFTAFAAARGDTIQAV